MAGHKDKQPDNGLDKEYRYSGRVPVPSNRLVSEFQQWLRGHGFTCEECDYMPGHYISKSSESSFCRAVISGLPSVVLWRAKEVTDDSCDCYLSFEVPSALKRQFYVIAACIAAVTLGLGLLALESVRVSLVHMGVSGHLISIVWGVLLIAAVGLLSPAVFLYTLLSERYLHFTASALDSCFPQSNVHWDSNLPFAVQRTKAGMLDISIYIALLSAFLLPPLLLHVREIPRLLLSSSPYEVLTRSLLLVGAGALCLAVMMTSNKRSRITYTPCLCHVMVVAVLLLTVGSSESVGSAVAVSDGVVLLPLLRSNSSEEAGADSIQRGMPSNSAERRAYVWALAWEYCYIVGLGVIAIAGMFALAVVVEHQFVGGSRSEYQRDCEVLANTPETSTHRVESDSVLHDMVRKSIVAVSFVSLSLCCWLALTGSALFCMRLLGVRVWNTTIYPVDTWYRSAEHAATVVLGVAEHDWRVGVVTWILAFPCLVPFVGFVGLHIWNVWLSFKRNKRLIPVTGHVAYRIQCVARDMGEKEVECLLDLSSTGVSPKADCVGMRRKKAIILTEAGKSFIEECPECGTAILAHEVAHLRYDCRRIWFLRLLSRLGLVGAGFLSVMLDSIKLEDRADDAARRYLRDNGMEEDMFEEAVVMLLALEMAVEGGGTQLSAARAISVPQRHAKERSDPLRVSLPATIKRAWSSVYDMYFKMDVYGYVHRDVCSRCIRS